MTRQHPARWLFLVVVALVLVVSQVAPATGVSARVPGAMTTTGHAIGAVSSPQPCTPNDGTGVSLTRPLALTPDGNAITGVFANTSVCPQEVGLASYQVQGILLGDQFLFDAITTTLQPAIDVGVVTATLTVQLPLCRYQVDAFYGDVIPSDGGFPNYGIRAIGARLGTRACATPTPATSVTDTPTGVPVGSATDTPTTTPTGSATSSPTPTGGTGGATSTPTETPQEGTATSSPTGSASDTSTPTSSATGTGTPTASGTAATTDTDTPTATASNTSSSTATATATPTGTRPANTETATPSSTVSSVATTGATDTPTPTATGGLSHGSTDTPTPTATDTATTSGGTQGATATATQSPTDTATTPGNRPRSAATATSTATNTPTTTAGGTAVSSSDTPTATPTATATTLTSPHVFKKTNTVQQSAPHASTTLRPTSATVGTKVTVTGHGFVAGEQITLALDAEALQTTPHVIITTGASGTAPHVVTAAPNGTFSATFVTPNWLLSGGNTVSAIGNVSHELSASTLTGRNLPAVSRLYFAGGVETASTHAAIALLNTGTKLALAKLTFYYGHGKTLARQLTIPRRTQLAVPVAALVGRIGAFGLALNVDRRVAVQLDLSRLNGDGTTVLGRARLGTTWYLAAGSTRAPFHETVALLNPNRAATRVQLRLIPSAARKGRTILVRVPAQTELTVDLNRVKMSTAFGVVATSDHPVVVERTLTFGRGGYGLTAQAGAHAAATTWLFAEGDTTHGKQTSLAILNPGRRTARVTAEFRGTTGKVLARRTIVVAAGRRATMAVQAFLHNRRFAAIVTGTQPIVVERIEYTGAPALAHTVGSAVFGLNGPAAQWAFPLGDTGRGRSETLLLYNPFRTAVKVDALVYQLNGFVATRRIVVPSRTQYAMSMNRAFRHLSRFHGVVLRSTLGVVAEQIVETSDHTSLRATEGLAQ